MFQIPPAVNYPNQLVALVARYQDTPPEGNRMIPVEIDWGTMGGTNYCVSINLQNNATLNFSQIVALAVDNSDCGADIRFVFPDTSETTTIPAYSPKTIIEVFTNQVQFYVVAGFDSETVESGDQTRFSIHNSLPPPIAVPVTEAQEAASFNNITFANPAPADTQLIPATVSGSLEALNVSAQVGFSVTGVGIFQIKDGTGKVIAGAQVATAMGPGQNQNVLLINLTGIRVRFNQGLVLHISSSTLHNDSALAVNLYFRTP